MHILDDLNEAQRVAATTIEGPVLMLAGAGSGKTKTLTHRIAYLLIEKKVAPMQILAVTFTNKAAAEMRERIAKLLGVAPESRSFLPFLGTFHAVANRILRREAALLGYPSNFLIYDTSDSQATIKQILRSRHIDEKVFSPNAIQNLISSAKNELLNPEQYKALAAGRMQEMAADIYPAYQRALKEAGAMDFDDMIMQLVRLLKENKDVLTKYQEQFAYIMVDEYQDTNHAQYQLIRMLAAAHRNVCVVGDDWQCLPAGTMIDTAAGPKKIEDISRGSVVQSAAGYSRSTQLPVTATKKFRYDGDLVRIETASGQHLLTTPNHILFTSMGKTDSYTVYLMYNLDYGYRIGMTKGGRFDGKKHDIGLRVRANQERADRMWVIKLCSTRAEAQYQEALLSYQYGIPMLVFRADKNRNLQISQAQIDSLYDAIDTSGRAQQLMQDLDLDFNYPHFAPQATSRSGKRRINANIVLFGDKRVSGASPWSASRLSLNTTRKEDLLALARVGLNIRQGRAGTFRVEAHNLDYGKIEQLLEDAKISSDHSMYISRSAFLTDRKFMFMPAAQVHVGMEVPVLKGGVVSSQRVTKVSREHYSGFVYDLEIDRVHNYAASNIIVHNSIYSWRGANYENILNFEKDYPQATVVKLEQNYRSTQTILDAAHSVITKNTSRSDKKLWTDAGHGTKISLETVSDEQQEGRLIIQTIDQLRTQQPGLSLNDFAVLYRTNAQSRTLEEAFLRYNIPYQIVGGVRFYERKEIKDMMAYLRFMYQPSDLVSLGRIINLPPRGLGDTSIQRFTNHVRESGETVLSLLNDPERVPGLTPRAAKSLRQFGVMIEGLRADIGRLSVSDLIDATLKRSGYRDWLSDGSAIAEDRLENIQEFIGVAKAYDNLGLEEFLTEIALIADVDQYKSNADNVTLMTLHAAKGLEFDTVFMVGMEEGIFPHSRTFFDAGELEEERRLCYVGMTRAKQRLVMISAVSRMLYGTSQHNVPSRFLSDIPGELVQVSAASATVSNTNSYSSFMGAATDSTTTGFEPDAPFELSDVAAGERVRHPKFGDGTIATRDGHEVVVMFDSSGRKTLSLEYAPLTKI